MFFCGVLERVAAGRGSGHHARLLAKCSWATRKEVGEWGLRRMMMVGLGDWLSGMKEVWIKNGNGREVGRADQPTAMWEIADRLWTPLSPWMHTCHHPLSSVLIPPHSFLSIDLCFDICSSYVCIFPAQSNTTKFGFFFFPLYIYKYFNYTAAKIELHIWWSLSKPWWEISFTLPDRLGRLLLASPWLYTKGF